MVWGTFYSGSNSLDGTMSIETDANDNVYIAGYAGSIDFPTSNPLGGAYFQGTNSGVSDITIMKFSNTGVLLWATYYGGSVNDISASLAIDINGNVFVTGYTQSVDFPTFNPGASAYFQVANGGSQDIFILKFNTVGLRLWATYYGGSANDRGNGIAIDSNGNSYITGSTSSANFPVLNPLGGTYFQGAYAGGFGELFIVKCSNTGVLLWATYYGGSGVELGSSITTDLNNNILITGYTNSVDFPLYNPLGGAYFQAANAGSNEIIILKFSDIGIPLWATYYGGSSSEIGSSIATDNIGNVFVMGQTNSSDFPTYNPSGCSYFQGTNAGGSDAAIIKFSNTGVLLWATYYGGSANENFFTNDNIAIDHCNNIYISFFTNSTALPFQAGFDGVGYHDNTYNGENSDIFIVLFSNTGVQLWNTYIGGDGRDMREALATDVNNNLFVTGEWRFVTNSASYPVVNPGGGAYYDATSNTSNDDSFILKFTPSNSPFAVNTDITLPTCTNPCTGTATVAIANQSTCAYSYLWSNGETSQTTSGLCTGTYSVTVTNLFCKDTVLIVTISGSGGSLTLIGNQTDTTCAASGAASVTVIGGNSPYTYQWNPSGQTSPIATGLSSGIYTVTVSDAVGCSSSTTVVVVKPTPLVAQYTKGTAACANCGCQEWILVNAISGTVPYTYLWPDGYNKRYKNKLCPGNYTVKVTDKNGCSVDVNVSTP